MLTGDPAWCTGKNKGSVIAWKLDYLPDNASYPGKSWVRLGKDSLPLPQPPAHRCELNSSPFILKMLNFLWHYPWQNSVSRWYRRVSGNVHGVSSRVVRGKKR